MYPSHLEGVGGCFIVFFDPNKFTFMSVVRNVLFFMELFFNSIIKIKL